MSRLSLDPDSHWCQMPGIWIPMWIKNTGLTGSLLTTGISRPFLVLWRTSRVWIWVFPAKVWHFLRKMGKWPSQNFLTFLYRTLAGVCEKLKKSKILLVYLCDLWLRDRVVTSLHFATSRASRFLKRPCDFLVFWRFSRLLQCHQTEI